VRPIFFGLKVVSDKQGACDLNGLLARLQRLARAAGPVLAVGLASAVGYGAVYGVLAIVMAVLAFSWQAIVEA